MGYGCYVAEAKHTAIGLHWCFGNRLRAVESACDAQGYALGRGFYGAGRHHRVLPSKRLEYRFRRDAKRREFGVGKLDVDLFVLRAVQVDLSDVLDLQQALSEPLGHLLHLGVVGALGREHIENRINVAVFIVDRQTDQSRGQVVLDVADLLAQLIEQLRHIACRRVVLESNLHRSEGWLGVSRNLVEIGQLLELFLDRVGNLRLHLGSCCSRPHGGDHNHLDGE